MTLSATPKLAVVRDFREEGWPSMDLMADMLLEQLHSDADAPTTTEIAPPFRALLTAIPTIKHAHSARNFDRLWNRFVTLNRAVRKSANRCDAFHIVDHSHAHLVHALPAERTGVYCHDLDTFRCLLEPEKEPRPLWFRLMARRILSGLRKAAVVFHNSRSTGDELLRWKLVDAGRLLHVPLGVAAEFAPDTHDSSSRDSIRGSFDSSPYLLHIGSCIPRKRIEFLLQLFAELRERRTDLLLLKAGDPWTVEQEREIERLGVASSIRHLGRLPREQLADVIRGASAVVIPSDAEGFGLPVIEALACGVPVVASDLPALAEAGGDVARYAPVGDLARWLEAVGAAMAATANPAERRRRREWTAQFSWRRHARAIAAAYRGLLARR